MSTPVTLTAPYFQEIHIRERTLNCQCLTTCPVLPSSCIKEGKLYYVGPKKDEKREVVIDAERKRQIFLDCHFNDIGHHLGQKKTVHRIQSKYYWLGIIKDVVDWVNTSLCVVYWCTSQEIVISYFVAA